MLAALDAVEQQTRKENLGFHSTWVEQPMLAAVDAVETAVEEVGVAEEPEADVPTPPYQARQLK
jgi:hypothetical protein